MNARQRIVIWAATAAVVALAAAFAWRSATPNDQIRLELRLPSLPMPDPNKVLMPNSANETMLLVVIENTPQARPQSGLAEACLVYAMPTEARITRFLAAYCNLSPKVIGPVRSARRYMLEIASDIGAVLVHAGQSTEAFQLITGRRLPVLNQFWTPEPFWRDSARQMPHNLYTGLDRLRTTLARKPVMPRKKMPYRFGPEARTMLSGGTPAPVVSLDYGPLYAVRYRYDAARRRYLREQDGRPHLDADGRQIAPASVITVFVEWRDVQINGIPSSKIDLFGSGLLAILSEGRLVEGTWRRPNNGPLKLEDSRGRPVVLPPGPVWIELFPEDLPFEVQGEPGR